jgi:phage-related protein
MWKVQFYESRRGEKLAKAFIELQPLSTRSKISHMLDLLEEYGPEVKMPYVRKISFNLSEIRIKGKIQVRIFFTIQNKTICVLHAFVKKTQRIPIRELRIAYKRLAEI